MELFIYIGLAIVAIFFSFTEDAFSQSNMFFTFWITAYISLILVVRTTFDFDIRNYAETMTYQSISIYYLKEPIVWLGHRFIYFWVQNPFYVFLLSDFLIGLILFRALKNFNLPKYAFFSILIFFPFVLGMQNIYRQWVANILFLYSFSIAWNQSGNIKKYISFMAAVLSHNAAAIFVPLLFIKRTNSLGQLKWYGSFFIATVGIMLGAETKSKSNAGNDFTLLYFFLILFLLILIPLLDRGLVRKIRALDYYTIVTILFLSGCSIIFLASAGAERVAMFGLIVAYPIIVKLIENRFKQKALPRAVFSLLGFMPMLLFSVSIFLFGCVPDLCVQAP